MFRWTKEIPSGEEAEWETKLALADVFTCFHHEPGSDQVRIESFLDDEGMARRLAGMWGGEVEAVGEHDWVLFAAREWLGHVLPVRDRFLVTLDDREGFLQTLREEHPDRELLVFPPGLAFGTGDHATTATCLDLLVEEAERGAVAGKEVLDLGCGTGILGIAAAKLGAARVIGIDLDVLSVQAARRYWEENGSPGGEGVSWVQADVLEWVPPGPADLVLANLFSEILRQAMPGFRESVRPGGTAILSGILETQADGVVASAEAVGFRLQRRIGAGPWVTLLFRRAPAI